MQIMAKLTPRRTPLFPIIAPKNFKNTQAPMSIIFSYLVFLTLFTYSLISRIVEWIVTLMELLDPPNPPLKRLNFLTQCLSLTPQTGAHPKFREKKSAVLTFFHSHGLRLASSPFFLGTFDGLWLGGLGSLPCSLSLTPQTRAHPNFRERKSAVLTFFHNLLIWKYFKLRLAPRPFFLETIYGLWLGGLNFLF